MTIAEKLTAVAENTPQVYAAGQKAEYDRFWDALQDHGRRTNYQTAFTGQCMPCEVFFPKYDMHPTAANQMFYAWNTEWYDRPHVDLAERLKSCGVTLDTSNCTTFRSMFAYNRRIDVIPALDLTKATDTSYMFAYAYSEGTKTVEKLTVSETTPFDNAFHSCNILKNITFEGTIGQALSFAFSPLTNGSIQSVIDCLKDLTGETAKTLTVSTTTAAGLTAAQIATVTAKNWTLVY